MQHFTLAALFLLLACSALSVTAKKSGGGGKPKIYKFNIELADGKKAGVQVRAKNDVYTLAYKDKEFTKNGYEKGTVIYDYSDPTDGIVAVVTGKGSDASCYYKSTGDTLGDMKATLLLNSNKAVSLSEGPILDGRGSTMEKSKIKKFLKKHKSLTKMCRKAKIIELTPLDANAPLANSKNISFVGMDNSIDIVVTDLQSMTNLIMDKVGKRPGNSGSNSGGNSGGGLVINIGGNSNGKNKGKGNKNKNKGKGNKNKNKGKNKGNNSVGNKGGVSVGVGSALPKAKMMPGMGASGGASAGTNAGAQSNKATNNNNGKGKKKGKNNGKNNGKNKKNKNKTKAKGNKNKKSKGKAKPTGTGSGGSGGGSGNAIGGGD